MRGIGVVLVGTAVLLLAACGGGGAKTLSPEQSKQALVDATHKTLAETAHLDLSVTLRQVSGQGAAVYGASGDLGPSGGHLKIDQRSVGGNLRQEILARRNGHLVLYENPSSVKLPKGKQWLELDLTRYGMARYGANTTFLAGADQDPFAALTLATAGAATVTDLGLEWLPDQTLNTHYRASVDVLEVAKEKGVKGKGLQALTADVGTPKETVDIWVSKKGRVARVQVRKTLRDANTGALLRQSSIVDFSRFGERVRTTLPPAARVADFFALAR